MPRFNSRTGAANLGTPLMILTFAVIGGFVYWLSVTAEPTQVAIVEDTSSDVSESVVSMVTFSADTKAYVDQEIELRGIPVTSALGPHSFWTSLADANDTPFLIHLGGTLISDSTTFTPGAAVDIIGTVTAMSDSILNAWEAEGAFPGPADRIQAEFAEDFIEATSIIEVPPAG